MTGWGAAMVAAALATLAHPRWWVISLAGFLVRGGVLALLLPIVVPPTVASVMSLLAPTVVGQVIVGGPNTPVALVVGVTTLFLFVVIWIAGTLGASFDAALVADAVDDDELALDGVLVDPPPPGLGTVRLGPHLLTALVFVVAAARIVQVVYAEATSPGAPTLPFVLRVIDQTPVQVGALVAAVLVSEAVGGLALRAMLLEPSVATGGGLVALARAVRAAVRPAALATLVLTTLVTIVVALPGALAAGRAWGQVRIVFGEPAEVPSLAIGLLLFVAVVLGWFTLLGVALAWRATAWTLIARATAATTVRVSEVRNGG